MKIIANNIGKKFNRNWIFRSFDKTIEEGHYAIVGPNGSGKSTLLKILSGFLSPSEGKIKFFNGENEIKRDEIFSHVSLSAPYLSLVENFDFQEMLNFHFQFKSIHPKFSLQKIQEFVKLPEKRALKNFSSGMLQRVKLVLACCSDTDLLFLDEPATNLDREGIQWFHELLKFTGDNRIVIISSNNQKDETQSCTATIDLTTLKAVKKSVGLHQNL